MAKLQNSFDSRNVDPTQTAPALPVGKHPVVIESSEIKENSKKDGGFVEFGLVIIDGPSKGQKGAYRLNLYHSNAQTVEIAYKQLSALCHVTGVYQVEDTMQLHNIPFIVEVELQKGEEAKAKGYTQVVRVYDRNGNEPGKQSQGPAPAQTTAPAQAPQAWSGAPGQTLQQPQPAAAGWGNQGGAPQAQAQPQHTGQPAWSAPQAGNGGGGVPGAQIQGGAPPWGQR